MLAIDYALRIDDIGCPRKDVPIKVKDFFSLCFLIILIVASSPRVFVPTLLDKDFRGSTIFVTSWDDGPRTDLRLASILAKYQLKGTFFVISQNIGAHRDRDYLSGDDLRSLAKMNMEIGSHTVSHRHLSDLTDKEIRWEIVESKRVLESILGTPVTSFCYLFGDWGGHEKQSTIAAALRDSGYLSGRTTERLAPILVENLSLSPMLLPVTMGIDDVNLNEELKTTMENPGHFGSVFHLWGHSWMFADDKKWEQVDRLFAMIAGISGLSAATQGELARYLVDVGLLLSFESVFPAFLFIVVPISAAIVIYWRVHVRQKDMAR